MSQRYESEFKKQIVRLHMEQGRTLISLQKEYNVSKAAISKWVRQFREECQNNQDSKQDYDKIMTRCRRFFVCAKNWKKPVRRISS